MERPAAETTPYDAHYYSHHCGPLAYGRTPEWLAFFADVAVNLIRLTAPRTVLDAGCAWGFLVEAFWDRGVEATGIDVSEYAIAQVRPDVAPYCRVGSITDPVPGRYDLVTCIEVLEHVPADQMRTALEHLAAVTDTIFFSSSPDDFAEPTHCNVRPPVAWIRSFAEVGFVPDIRVDVSFLAPHALLFRRAAARLAPDVEALVAERSRLASALAASRQRESALTATIRELEQRQSESAVHARNLEGIAAERAVQFADAQQRIAALEAAGIENRRQLDAAALKDAGREAELASRDGAIAVRDAELRHHRERLEESGRLVRAQADAIAAHAQRVTELTTERDTALAERAELDALIAARTAEVRAENDALQAMIDTVRTSKFWRVKLALARLLGRSR